MFKVDFHRQQDGNDVGGEQRLVHRVIYDYRSHYPAKKMLTFAKHTKDFEFAINYGDLGHLREEQIRYVVYFIVDIKALISRLMTLIYLYRIIKVKPDSWSSRIHICKNSNLFFSQFGELNISRVDLRDVANAISKHSGDDFQFKGVKAHFRMDDSGIVHMENVCFYTLFSIYNMNYL